MVYGGILHNKNDIDEDNVNLETLNTPGKLSIDNKVTGGYALGEYGFDSTLAGGVLLGGSNSKSDLSNGSNVEGDAFYMGLYMKKDIKNWRVIGGLGYQYTDYDAKRVSRNMVQSFSYDKDYSDKSYNIYLSGRYSHDLGNNWFLEPKAKLAYEHISQEDISEDSKPLSMSVDSKDFDIFEGAIGLDIKKVFPLETGKNSVRAGVNYNRIFDGKDSEFLNARMENGSDFDIFVPGKVENQFSINLGFEHERPTGIIFQANGSYSFNSSHDDTIDGDTIKTKQDGWMIGAGLGYKF